MRCPSRAARVSIRLAGLLRCDRRAGAAAGAAASAVPQPAQKRAEATLGRAQAPQVQAPEGFFAGAAQPLRGAEDAAVHGVPDGGVEGGSVRESAPPAAAPGMVFGFAQHRARGGGHADAAEAAREHDAHEGGGGGGAEAHLAEVVGRGARGGLRDVAGAGGVGLQDRAREEAGEGAAGLGVEGDHSRPMRLSTSLRNWFTSR